MQVVNEGLQGLKVEVAAQNSQRQKEDTIWIGKRNSSGFLFFYCLKNESSSYS